MLHVKDRGDDPEIDRQMSEEQRLLPWDLSKVKLFYQDVWVEDTVLDPATRACLANSSTRARRQSPTISSR